jgi:hypothetical protein
MGFCFAVVVMAAESVACEVVNHCFVVTQDNHNFFPSVPMIPVYPPFDVRPSEGEG